MVQSEDFESEELELIYAKHLTIKNGDQHSTPGHLTANNSILD